MKGWENVQTFITGVFPDVVAVDSSGAATPDGTEYIAAQINNGIFGWTQDFLNYAGLTPDGTIEADGTSQLREAIQKGNGIGPGMYVQRAIYDSPAVNGDRVIILAEQGVLIATYPELDAACWIGGDTAAQIAAIAAGKKFYRSSDAPGLVGDAAGPYIQLPAQPEPKFLKQYLGDESGSLDITLTNSVAGLSVVRAAFIPYQTSDGAWRMIFNTEYAVNTNTTNTLTISGVLFKNVSGFDQSVTVGATADWSRGLATPNTANIIVSAGTTETNWKISGNVELDSKPTWADDFDIEWGITY